MYYEEQGSGDPIVFLHGNPTSSFLWRKVTPSLSSQGRCLAPDLIGMGRSGKPNIAYRFFDHARYLSAWFEALELDRVTLVGHDWGAALGLDWASRNSDRVVAVSFMEALIKPFGWEDWPEVARPYFEAFRTPDIGEQRILDENQFVEFVLPVGMHRQLEPDEMDVYRSPFRQRWQRVPMLAWPRCLPIDGEPADVVAAFEAFDAWLASTPQIPKLLIAFEPGVEILAHTVNWCRENIAGLEVAHGGPGLHYVQEDQPDAIARLVGEWRERVVA